MISFSATLTFPCVSSGREQGELTGHRLSSLGLKYDVLIHSSMARATETAHIISKHLPGSGDFSHMLIKTALRVCVLANGLPFLLVHPFLLSLGVELLSCDLLQEGAPIEPVPPVTHWKPDAVVRVPPRPRSSVCGSFVRPVFLCTSCQVLVKAPSQSRPKHR